MNSSDPFSDTAAQYSSDPFYIIHIKRDDFFIFDNAQETLYGIRPELAKPDRTAREIMSAQETLSAAKILDEQFQQICQINDQKAAGRVFQDNEEQWARHRREDWQRKADILMNNLALAEKIFESNLGFIKKLKSEMESARAKVALVEG